MLWDATLNIPYTYLFYIFIELEMDGLLFTFSKQQISQQLPSSKNHQDKLTDFLLSYQ